VTLTPRRIVFAMFLSAGLWVALIAAIGLAMRSCR
jgi:hypothetical protein